MSKKQKPNSAQIHTCGLPGDYGQNCDILITAYKKLHSVADEVNKFTQAALTPGILDTIGDDNDMDFTANPALKDALKVGYIAGCNQFAEDLSSDLSDLADEIDDAKLFFVDNHESHTDEVDALNEEIAEIKDFVPDDRHNGSETGQANLILSSLFSNCTVQELEALEMLMRIKKGNQYVALRDGVPHPDNVDLGILFGQITMAVSKKGNQYATVLIPKA
jgi:hypothetical protein